MERIDILIELATKTAVHGEYCFKTGVLSKKIGVSQQSISNILIELEKKNLINRAPSIKGINISLTSSGKTHLESYKNLLNDLFKKTDELEGEVFTGIGEGGFYIMQKGYQKQFKKKLGFTPYNGTLNLKVNPSFGKNFILGKKIIKINGFKSNTRTFGALNAYKVKINNLPSALIIPERTHYNHDTFELISNYFLRKKLKLKDGDVIKITEG